MTDSTNSVVDEDFLEPITPLAAIDLGSNSFHVILAIKQPKNWRVIDRHKELTRLASGLGESRQIRKKSMNVAHQALLRIGQRIRPLPRRNVRIVGTQALRVAKNSNEFIKTAQKILGHKIEIISGREEARLIYLGANHSFDHQLNHRLVVDIGGGSTEIVSGERFETHQGESLPMGCTSITEKYFPKGRITKSGFKRAINRVMEELQGYKRYFPDESWELALGTSGTIQAIQKAINSADSPVLITKNRLGDLRRQLVEFGNTDTIDTSLCSKERARVFPGGVAILTAVFQSLDIDEMHVTDGALREGLLYDLCGRIQDQDVRESTVLDLLRRFHIDERHARRVEDTALHLFDQVKVQWELDEIEDRLLLRWSALLHEIGLDISHVRYHRHGEYLLHNLDLPGFSLREQMMVANLVLAHRRKFPTKQLTDDKSIEKLAILLRLAVVLRRNRTSDSLPRSKLTVNASSIHLELPKKWLKHQYLTLMDIEREMRYLRSIDYKLSLSDR
ncbi:MAG: Ppx/GppA phosphatase family protein [Gammaproteobacteria bacterium]|nr:Ppx/GppA phosphatase family protein [Gammaproteobacteria bacterium]